MKPIVKSLPVAVCLLALSAIGIQHATAAPVTEQPIKEPSAMIVGGYQNTDITPEIKKIAQFALKTQSKKTKTRLQLVNIDSAASQVVAGTNFKLILTIKDHQKTNQAEAIVYRDLNGHKQLSSWNWLIK